MSFPDFTMRRIGLATTAVIAAVAFAGTAAAQSMVVRSTGPSAGKYPTGTKLKSTDRLTLVSGDKIVLMQAGKTRTLSGPGTFGATGTIQASQSMGATVTRMLSTGPTMRSRGGFSRGAAEPVPIDIRAPNLWLVDFREGGTFCVADPERLTLWRPNMDTDQLLKIEQGDKAETVAIVAGANFRKWPTEAMPIQYGVDYRLSGAGLAKPVTIRFTPMGPLPDSAENSVDMLMAKGCTPQLDRLVSAMSDTEAAGG
ncbi:hypothetical protein CVO77_17505 [Sphingopyxis lindanitolerans]|uniref:DUF4412 domain-containing protein n=1 Tax=Sphingopyxis lindanitolerans TaxID=2054227 RepID=A0A2S8B2Z9_9SPHN|nr:hypothetical protein [Sphingopyxis lindanitolerans]PQM26785.1 hypothetical protein CVO77_17505 [Sphingopyxis lindanitolerans]